MGLIPYLGHKEKFANFIVPNIPNDISTYIEPFGGMMGVFFSLDFTKYKGVKFIYNDINKLNSDLFLNLKKSEFISIVNNTNVSEDIYLKSFNNLFNNNSIDYNSIYTSLDCLIILTCGSPYEVGKYSWIGSSEFDIFKIKYKAYNFHINKIDTIHNIDYKSIINIYDSPNSFFYLDPPYFKKEKYYINHNFSDKSHIELSKKLKNLRGRFLLSYYNFDDLRDIYSDYKIIENKTIMGTELLIMNYDLESNNL